MRASTGRGVDDNLDLGRLQRLDVSAGESLQSGTSEGQHRIGGFRAGLSNRPRVLFLCTHNSARSQMAEGLLRHVAGDQVDVYSAGTVATRVHPLAIAAMAEKGIDISRQRSKHVVEFAGETFDYVVTVCDDAREVCPIFPGAPERIHWSIADPSAVEGDDETRLRAFRAASDELMTRIRHLVVLIARRQA